MEIERFERVKDVDFLEEIRGCCLISTKNETLLKIIVGFKPEEVRYV